MKEQDKFEDELDIWEIDSSLDANNEAYTFRFVGYGFILIAKAIYLIVLELRKLNKTKA